MGDPIRQSRDRALQTIKARLVVLDIMLKRDANPIMGIVGISALRAQRGELVLSLLLGRKSGTLHLHLGRVFSELTAVSDKWKHEVRLSFPVAVSSGDTIGEWHFHREDTSQSLELLNELGETVASTCHAAGSNWPTFRRAQLLKLGDHDRQSPTSPFYLGVVLEAMLQRFLREGEASSFRTG